MPPKIISDRKSSRRNGPRIACDICRRKKVRCDGVRNGFPCSNCRTDEVHCALRPARKRENVIRRPLLEPSKTNCTSLPTLLPSRLTENLFESPKTQPSTVHYKSNLPPVSSIESYGNGYLFIPPVLLHFKSLKAGVEQYIY
jgi:hypothetical protein